jgi:hypothetical protein
MVEAAVILVIVLAVIVALCRDREEPTAVLESKRRRTEDR